MARFRSRDIVTYLRVKLARQMRKCSREAHDELALTRGLRRWPDQFELVPELLDRLERFLVL